MGLKELVLFEFCHACICMWKRIGRVFFFLFIWLNEDGLPNFIKSEFDITKKVVKIYRNPNTKKQENDGLQERPAGHVFILCAS